MSDQGERTCPLCAEEMDLTDQQLKPCKCGYEICIWCWHHIMDMAEKDEAEGRCPACRTPYNKEKIVGMAANCERLVAEMNIEKKMKSQKAKSKPSDGRKQLSSSMRVIQRNLVYIVGLPLNLADEDLLQHGEYFGQYGKVLKVSISRTAAGTIQQFPNNTCSVYVTYSKEEEAVRCIQSVHGFVLDGSSLRACFGTTKYCHSWLRNVPCSNPDCLYLHDFGSQEDSFTKDEIISAYTRSKVQQITGATNMQRRSGNVLPPPADEYYINSSISSGKPIIKSASNNPATSVSGSPPNSGSSQSVALPTAAFWGMRASNIQLPSGNFVRSNGLQKTISETCNGSMAFSKAVASTTQVPLVHIEFGKKLIPNGEDRSFLYKAKQEPLESGRQDLCTDRQSTSSEAPTPPGLPATLTVNGQLQSPSMFEDKDRCINLAPNITDSFNVSGRSNGPGLDKDLNISVNGNIQNLCSDMASINIDRHLGAEHSGDTKPNGSSPDNIMVKSQNKGLQQCYSEHFREPSTSIALGEAVASAADIGVTREQSDQKSSSLTREQSDWTSDSQTQLGERDARVACPKVEEDLQHFEDHRFKNPEVVTDASYFPDHSHSYQLSCHSRVHSPQQNAACGSTSYNRDPQILDNKVDNDLLLHSSGVPKIPNGYSENIITRLIDSDKTTKHSYVLPSDVKKKHIGRIEAEAANVDQNVAKGLGESSIISNILSMDFDAWDDSLTSPQSLAKLLGETDRREGSLKLSSSWKVQNSSQSRFSFARQEDPKNQVSDHEPSLSNIGKVLEDYPLSLEFAEKRDCNFDKLGDYNGSSTFTIEESNYFAGSYSHLHSNKLSVSRAQVSAPPGFSLPSRAPPPGFASHERMEPTFDAMSWNSSLNTSSSMRNLYQAPPTENVGSAGDIEFMDPAILAVGKGRLPVGLNNAPGVDMRSNFSSQLSAFENEARLQLLMQRSLSPLQNHRLTDLGDGIAPFNDAYRIPSRIMEQTMNGYSPPSQQSRTSVVSNGQWDGWNEVQSGNGLGMVELLRTERLGFNKLYSGYEDSKYRMPSSGNLYNRTYGI
ncbi:General negative regulator of transcription C16C9.04c like [Actinidia chinensis var. chinensis]|uniref:General negative regulator of transcription C16C9.04c like n=1 Tax=Actinidia chinensis var. chinensis TaxID=1590841 RepID=A0A2R6P7L6_ACTCC|nr:General negative regulator of transcription C16C9.04c like [Actinidia chinensis var. chinensis]